MAATACRLRRRTQNETIMWMHRCQQVLYVKKDGKERICDRRWTDNKKASICHRCGNWHISMSSYLK